MLIGSGIRSKIRRGIHVGLAASLVYAAAGNGPYTQWVNGPTSDPAFFPIGVWLQSPGHISEFKNIGINTFVGFYGSLDQTSLSQYAAAQMPLLATQNTVGLSSPQNTAIKGWTQLDEPDNAQPDGNGGYGPCIGPSTIVANYNSIRGSDATRPVFLNFGRAPRTLIGRDAVPAPATPLITRRRLPARTLSLSICIPWQIIMASSS